MNLDNFETMDPAMLLSIVNLKLRNDFDGKLDELAKSFDIDQQKLEAKLASAGFEFMAEIGQFR
ncbi:DUF4250 domain-containing protein [Reinekea thalattae]|uniref:DUF4250 domain-containing protein n=1 Tax=Reinekea thalattae TaxID=2593301 RepID=A0A5C8Z8X7_9GAMM|nr:DUF4250 domain-containing protein [Reinekea thalattae]TXR53693.1 DUF4250 domain-containing protein [Reinekea thalattae]